MITAGRWGALVGPHNALSPSPQAGPPPCGLRPSPRGEALRAAPRGPSPDSGKRVPPRGW